jgi:DNA repair exonuclease SbcCD ATPase subunit
MFGSEKYNADEIGRLWKRLIPLENARDAQAAIIQSQIEEIELLKEKIQQPSENQQIAQQAARSAAQHKGKIQRTKDDVENLCQEIQKISSELSLLLENTKETVQNLDGKIKSYDNTFNRGEELFNEINTMHQNLEEKINDTIELFEKNNDLEDRINNATEQLESFNEIESRAQGILKNITTSHAKVKELRDEILGYDTENEDGESQRIDGIKDQLESTYVVLKSNITELNDYLTDIDSNSKISYQSLLEDAKSKTEECIKKQENQYSEVYQKIITLLPAALTTGLSAAYNEKITSESSELVNHNKTFSNAIKWLVCISFIPFLADLYLLVVLEKDLVSVISETPKLVLSILPLYFPILWMAYSSNKKMNLSKD